MVRSVPKAVAQLETIQALVEDMLQLLLNRRPEATFKSRSTERNVRTDSMRTTSMSNSIDRALHDAQAEHAGLQQRLNDALARAAVTSGNSSDEYLDREPENAELQNLLSSKIDNGERRLRELEMNMSHFRFLKAVLATRFPQRAPETA
jgi:hypothetical protein